MGNPRKFSRIARRLAMAKPVIVVKSGSRAAAHPRASGPRETEADPAAFTAMLRQAGVVHADTIHQMFDAAQVLIYQPEPPGDRVAIVGNSVQLSALTAQAAESAGLRIAHGPSSVDAEAPLDQFRKSSRKPSADPGTRSW